MKNTAKSYQTIKWEKILNHEFVLYNFTSRSVGLYVWVPKINILQQTHL